jgi:hypothetical protein
MDKSTVAHSWKFFRTGGLDQVALETAADLQHLDQLDPKLWVALSCPVKGLELPEKTLALIDTDNDGRIRVPELLAAVKWAAARLKEPAALLKGEAALPLAAIADATPDGQALVASARRVLANLGKADATAIVPADTSDTAKIFASSSVNGDGVIPPDATDDAAVQTLIKDILATVGGAADRAGSQGVTSEKVDEFFKELAAHVDWVGKSSAKEIAVLGEQTDAAVAAIRAVRAKVEDYFARCRLAAFDARAIGALNRAEADYLAVAAKDLKLGAEEVAGFPLARIAPAQPLPLLEGVNPAWAAALATLHRTAIAPVHGAAKDSLTEEEWHALSAQFAAYETWLGTKGGSAVEKLGLARVKEILASDGRAKLAALVAKDKALEPQFKALSDVDRLVHYYRDLRALLHNFVNFADFYSRDRWAIFQSGTLYLDSRSTELCVRVDGPSPLAAMSKTYIAYCTCTRQGKTMAIAACFTQGDSDYLFVGRHGVFWDRAGNDWDAVITNIIDSPISIRQAFWSPYKKFVRMIDEQIAKRAAAAEAASSTKLASAAEHTANIGKEGPPAAAAPAKKVDVGTVAALGVAFGALTTAFGYFLGFFKGMPVWQLPLVIIGAMLLISLPSMAIAWMKLRQRTLGPLLEANGWAVNGRVKINMPLGSALTEMARKPAGSRMSFEDPYEDKEAARRKRLAIFWVIVFVLAGAAAWIRWDAIKHADENGKARYFWQDRAAPAKAEAPKADAPADEKPAPAPKS